MAKKDTKETAEKQEKVVVEIIRGRMPVAIAAAIKLTSSKDDKDADLAAKYRTTNGKISDIRAGRNFAYIDEGFKPSKEMVAAAKEYADQLEDGAAVMKAIKAMGVATKEEEEAFAESRKSTRKTNGKPKKATKKEEPEVEDDGEDDVPGEDELDDLLE